MAKGENIFKRKDGRWEARYIKGYESSGKIKYGFCYGKTYKEAKEKVSKFKSALLTGQSLTAEHTRHRFSFYCDEWLKYRRLQVKESTYVKYEAVLRRHIKPKLGSCFPLQFTTPLIDSFTRELLLEAELSPKTVHDILLVLHEVLKYTATLFPAIFPQIEMHYPKCKRKEIRVLTREEQNKFISYLLENLDTCKFGLLLALCTGMRIGELCALRWGDISLEERVIHVHATLQRLKDFNHVEGAKTKVVIGSPKSETSIRTIPLTDVAFSLCERMNPHCATAYVLTGTEEYMEPRTLQYRLKKFTADCGLEGVHCHTLRHTFATRAVEVGFEIKSLSEVLGHSTTKITLDRYVHTSIELKRDNMNKLSTIGF